jgi:FkbM family methyltransferase
MDALLRRLPNFKGKIRMAKLLLGNSALKKKDVLVKGKYGCEYLLPNLLENVSFDILINGIYEEVTSGYFARHLPKNGVLLDLGANIGAITIPLKKQRPDARIVCVEAAAWLFRYLEDNLARNRFPDVRAINKALYQTDDEVLDFYSPDVKFGKGSLSPVYTQEAVKVTTITLDSLVKEMGLPKTDLVKLDVEGYEYHVFRGGAALLSGPEAPDILFEFAGWAEELAGLKQGSAQIQLKEYGYSLFEFDVKGVLHPLDGILPEGNAMLLATKKNRK